jgi:hypothetical protein
MAWVRWLEAGGHDPGRRRRFVMKRVYWNSHNEVYRKIFEDAGFEAFACRSEAKSKRSTADMVIALDAQEALFGEDRIREFVLLTTDTDFVPLVDRLVARGRKVVVLVDERDVSSAVYRERSDVVIARDSLSDAAQLPLEAYKIRLGFWGPVTVGPFPVHVKTPRKVRKARARNQPALARAAELVARDLMGRGVRRMERERLPRLLSRLDDFTIAGSEADRWFGWGTEDAFADELAGRHEAIVVTRSRRGVPQIELSDAVFLNLRSGGGLGFDFAGAAAEVARVAGERPGNMLNRARVTKLLTGFPTFTTSGARPFMGCGTYRNFVRTLVEQRDDLKLVPTPDGGVAIVYSSSGASNDPSDRKGKGRGRPVRDDDDDDGGPPPAAAASAAMVES